MVAEQRITRSHSHHTAARLGLQEREVRKHRDLADRVVAVPRMEMAVAVRHAGLGGGDPGPVAGGAGVAECCGEIAVPVAAEDFVGTRAVEHDPYVVLRHRL